MDIARELILAIAQVVDLAFSIYIFIIIVRALISWVSPDPYNPIVRFLHNATDPLLYRVRRIIPLQFGGIDFSPVAVLIALAFLQRVVRVLLYSLAAHF